jgi:hypothetical protein
LIVAEVILDMCDPWEDFLKRLTRTLQHTIIFSRNEKGSSVVFELNPMTQKALPFLIADAAT